MGAEREAAPKCPNGCKAEIHPVLSDDPTVLRWRCANIDCLRNFSTPRPGYGPSPLIRVRGDGEEEANVADLKCEKCDREFKHPKRLDTHQKKCKGPARGSAGDGSVKENPDLPMKRRPSTKASPRSSNGVGPLDDALDLLYSKRDALIQANPELDSVMNAIRALEEIKA